MAKMLEAGAEEEKIEFTGLDLRMEHAESDVLKQGSYDANRFTLLKAGQDEGRESKLLVEARRRRTRLE